MKNNPSPHDYDTMCSGPDKGHKFGRVDQASAPKFTMRPKVAFGSQFSPYYTTHVCQPRANVGKNYHKTSDPKIFISHIPVLNFAGTALHITPHM